MGLKIIFWLTFLSFNLLTGAESPVSEKQERINNVEYNETLKYKTTFLRKPPFCPLSRICEANSSVFSPLNEAGALAYYLTDQVDSVSTVLDDEGNTLSLMQYLPYGETFVQRGDLNFSPKFNSQELDRESGFYFFNARFYDPGIARFTSADTLIDGELDTQGWNRFSYVKGNPIGAKDPTGHDTFLYFYKSETTDSGAGHVAVGVGNTKKQTLYEANPENSNPISPMEKTYKHEGSMDEVLKKNHIGSKGKNPDLILQLKTDSKGAEDGKIKETAEKFFEKNKNWTVYNANCTDLAKQGTAQTKYKSIKVEKRQFPHLRTSRMIFIRIIKRQSSQEILKF
ncbi:RHS repeat domain-containing protein [Leptospira interrogans]|nr:RHS repeat-associated core domain-containing protein [Leptospira interrogans]